MKNNNILTINTTIPNTLLIENAKFDSLRGPYQAVLNFRYFNLSINYLSAWFNVFKHNEKNKAFIKRCEEEFQLFEKIYKCSCIEYENCFCYEELKNHPFWKGEEDYLIKAYVNLHINFMVRMEHSKYPSSRNTVSAEAGTCLTLLQRHNKTLYAVSRSCDISLGFYADLYTLYKYAIKYDLEEINWTITTPHIYTNNINGTIVQFETHTKQKLEFNKRKN